MIIIYLKYKYISHINSINKTNFWPKYNLALLNAFFQLYLLNKTK